MTLPANPSRSFMARNPQLYGATPNNRRPLPNPVAECHEAAALGTAAFRKAEGFSRITVRFVGFRVKPLDPDNFAGSVKDLLDGLRHAGLIPGDEPWRIKLETEQEKVCHFKDERTEITIAYP
jgi:hypothetical protein